MSVDSTTVTNVPITSARTIAAAMKDTSAHRLQRLAMVHTCATRCSLLLKRAMLDHEYLSYSSIHDPAEQYGSCSLSVQQEDMSLTRGINQYARETFTSTGENSDAF